MFLGKSSFKSVFCFERMIVNGFNFQLFAPYFRIKNATITGEINEPLLRSGRMWMQVGPKIHRLKFGTLAFALQKAPGLARTNFRLWDCWRPGEIVYDLQKVQILTLQSPEFEAVNFRANLHPHSPGAE